MQQPLCLAWDTMDSGEGGGASLQIENAQLKLHVVIVSLSVSNSSHGIHTDGSSPFNKKA